MVRFAKAPSPGAQSYPPAGPARDLHRAADEGDLETARALLSEDPYRVVNAAPFKLTPLHRAAAGGHADFAALLLASGATVDARDHAGRTPLHLAAEQGHLAAAKVLIDRGARLDLLDRGGDTALHKAARQGHVALAEALLARGADPNARGDAGGTPLHAAAGAGRREAVEALLAGGALANAWSTASPTSWTPLDEARQAGHGGIMELLAGHGGADRAQGPLGADRAAAMGYLGRLRLLLDQNPALVASRDVVRRRTPLHWAAASGRTAAADLLLSRGADPGAKDRKGATPIDVADSEGFGALADRLRAAAAAAKPAAS